MMNTFLSQGIKYNRRISDMHIIGKCLCGKKCGNTIYEVKVSICNKCWHLSTKICDKRS
jgi:hypothetical protein